MRLKWQKKVLFGGEEWGQHGGQVDDMIEKVSSLNHQHHIFLHEIFVVFFIRFPSFSHLSPPKNVVFNVEKPSFPFPRKEQKASKVGDKTTQSKRRNRCHPVTYIWLHMPHARQEYGKDALFDSLFPDLKQFKDWTSKMHQKMEHQTLEEVSETWTTLILLGWLWQPRSLVGHLAHVGLLATSCWRRGWDANGTQVPRSWHMIQGGNG